LRILKSNFKSQHANKNNRLPLSLEGGSLAGTQDAPLLMAAKGDGCWLMGGCTHKLSKRHSMPALPQHPEQPAII